jgi:hypothetical protein
VEAAATNLQAASRVCGFSGTRTSECTLFLRSIYREFVDYSEPLPPPSDDPPMLDGRE